MFLGDIFFIERRKKILFLVKENIANLEKFRISCVNRFIVLRSYPRGFTSDASARPTPPIPVQSQCPLVVQCTFSFLHSLCALLLLSVDFHTDISRGLFDCPYTCLLYTSRCV